MFVILFAWYSKERGSRFCPNGLTQQSMTTSLGQYPHPKHSIKPWDPGNSIAASAPSFAQGAAGITRHRTNTLCPGIASPRQHEGHFWGLLLSSWEATQVVALGGGITQPLSRQWRDVLCFESSNFITSNLSPSQRNAAHRIDPPLKEIKKGMQQCRECAALDRCVFNTNS